MASEPEQKREDHLAEGDRARDRARVPGAAGFRRATAGVFDTRTERWQQAGLSEQIAKAESRHALRDVVLFLLLLAVVLGVFAMRAELFPGAGKAVRYITAVLLVLVGWGLARAVARGIAPALLRRMDPATAGSAGFLIRLGAIFVVVIASLAIAGVELAALAVGGAFTAVVVGLAAQQTLGNVIAGAVLLSARPFRVADRVRLLGGGIDVEGTVASLGLFYTVLLSGGDRTLIPNSVLMSISVTPLREPDAVDVVARFESARVTPLTLQGALEEAISVQLVRSPEVALAEVGADGVSTFMISATPDHPSDGAQVAEEVLGAIARFGGEGDTDPHGGPAVAS